MVVKKSEDKACDFNEFEQIEKINKGFDPYLKLVVIDELLHKEPSFQDEILKQRRRLAEFLECDYSYDEYDELDEELVYDFAAEALKFFGAINFTTEDLAKVENLVFDGGLEVYQLIMPEWDGNDETFDVYSLDGLEFLPNLKSIDYVSIIDDKLIDSIKYKGIQVN